MGQQADAEERDDELELNLDDQNQGDPPGDDDEDQGDGGADDQDQDQDGGDADEEEDEITFGDGAAPAPRGEDSGLVKTLRTQLREKSERLAAYERGERPGQPQVIEVGDKPTLESCEYDEERFATELEAWTERRRQADEQQTEAQRQANEVNARFAEKVANFGRQKADLKVKDFDAVEEIVAAALSPVQSAVIIKVADNPAALTYALGRHPEKLATIAAINDPIELAAAVAKLEGSLKVTKRTRTPPEPDRPERGGAPLAAKTDKELERLEKEADRTGDRTALVAYRKRLKAQGRS